MTIIYVLIPIAMVFVLIAVGVFFWAVKSEQFDDLDRQSVSILFDDDNQQQAKQLSHSDNAKHKDSDEKPEIPL
ncbi:cbb3-type cytochrome oxidase assembly protein CcoS [Shewanella glacialimarina]|uniref:cbb3-type cytochrome oxidase assembly protein CcoS n=1 Tax=Shewanella glacialimarina TaxID=2590884 RepID=UPI001CF8F134|nr:cbb3-type cytochrome oxidase assembly protein CcoS [Shewanella glacialimarina]UCX04741.1 cbb3-type cytochrome oxidase assembly protein CcoS [Shewanella glacialimarina]